MDLAASERSGLPSWPRRCRIRRLANSRPRALARSFLQICHCALRDDHGGRSRVVLVPLVLVSRQHFVTFLRPFAAMCAFPTPIGGSRGRILVAAMSVIAAPRRRVGRKRVSRSPRLCDDELLTCKTSTDIRASFLEVSTLLGTDFLNPLNQIQRLHCALMHRELVDIIESTTLLERGVLNETGSNHLDRNSGQSVYTKTESNSELNMHLYKPTSKTAS
jgi:hypothetical protein